MEREEILFYINKAIEYLKNKYEDFDFDIEIKNKYKCYVTGDGKRMIIGTKKIEYVFQNGFVDHKSLQYIWKPLYGSFGEVAVNRYILHEFAHIIQFNKYKRTKQHGKEFIRILTDLIQDNYKFVDKITFYD